MKAGEVSDTVFVTNSATPIDTIIRTDTIVIREVITRTDVVHRTEKVVRFEETKEGSSNILYATPQPELSRKDMQKHQAWFGEGEGMYVWVPDSLRNKVNFVLNGGSVIGANGEEVVNNNEKVTFRGDTIPMVLRDRNLGRFDRGLYNFLFIPKGIWQIGLTASYGEFSTEDLEVLDLISDIDFKGHIFSVRPYFAYFLKNNISLGMRLGYTAGKASIGSFNVDIDEDMNFRLHDILYKSKSYSAAVTFSQYLGLTRRGRIGFFNEVELALAGGSSDFNRPFNGNMKMTHTDTFQTSLNFSPGLCVYVVDQLSFNVSFGVFGLSLRHDKQTENGVSLGSRTTSSANFRFNIFNINFGIAVNI